MDLMNILYKYIYIEEETQKCMFFLKLPAKYKNACFALILKRLGQE